MSVRDSAHVELLRRVPLLSALEPEELARVAALMKVRTCRKGDLVCREGDPGESFYVIASGELEVTREADPVHVLRRLGPGEVVGEMSLLLAGPRTATVRASRPARLLELDRADFNRFFAEHPAVLHHFSKLLSQRLAASGRAAPARPTLAVGVVGRASLSGKSVVARALAALLEQEAGCATLLVDVRSGQRAEAALGFREAAEAPDLAKSRIQRGVAGGARLTLGVADDDDEPSLVRAGSALVAALGRSFPCVVLDLGAGHAALDEASAEIVDVCVRVVEQARPGPAQRPGPTRTYEVLNLANEGSRPIPIQHCEPFVLPRDPRFAEVAPEAQGAFVRDEPLAPIAPPLRRLARKLLGRTVGIALGGGAAFGIAHLGVLRCFEEHGIPVDLVAGTSMGSIVALGWAAGLSPADMVGIAGRIGTRRTTLSALDVTLTKPGFLAGNRIVQIFEPLLGDRRRFEDLVHPARTVAADIESGERVWIGEGMLRDAFRASSSVPMIWAPVRRGEHVLVDGAMLDPVPAETAREMGADFVIAVNVVPPLRKGVTHALSRAWRSVNRWNPLSWASDASDLPNLFDIIMNSIQMLQHELGNYKAISADVRIVPDLSDFTWIEFYRPLELIERGRAAAEAALPQIQRELAGLGARPGADAGSARSPALEETS